MKVVRLLLVIMLAGPAAFAGAEFRVWTDAEGRRRVSNLPPSQVALDGTVREPFHPYGIAAQRARLRAELARRDAELVEETPLARPNPESPEQAHPRLRTGAP